jgi:hypothetical protein
MDHDCGDGTRQIASDDEYKDEEAHDQHPVRTCDSFGRAALRS